MWFIDGAQAWAGALEGAAGGWCSKAAPAEILQRTYWMPKPAQDTSGRPGVPDAAGPTPVAPPAPTLVDPTQTPVDPSPEPVGTPSDSMPHVDGPGFEVWVLSEGHNRPLFLGDDARLGTTLLETASMYGTFGDYSGAIAGVAAAEWPPHNGPGGKSLVWSCWSLTAALHVVLGLRTRVWPAERPSEVAGEAARVPKVTLRRADTGTWITVDAGDEFLNPALAALADDKGHSGVAGQGKAIAAPDLTLVHPNKPKIQIPTPEA